MSTEQLTRLATRADHVIGHADDRLAEVHCRIRATRRRRTAGAVIGACALVLAVVAGTALLAGPDSDPGPTRHGNPNPAGVVRPLTWTDEFWPSRHVHYGDQVIDTELDLTRHDFARMALTDDGIVLTTVDGRVWFTDGSPAEQIAATGVRSDFLGLLDVRTGASGSLAAWVDRRGALVVYDTSEGQVVVRRSRFDCSITWVGSDSLYARCPTELRRIDVATGRVTGASRRQQRAEMLAQGRALVVGDTFEGGSATTGVDVTFVRQGARLRAAAPGTTTPETLTAAFNSDGVPIGLRLPDGYRGAASFTVFQWLDDDRLALMAGAGTMGIVFGPPGDPQSTTGYGDIVVCKVSTGECRLAVPGQPPDSDGDGQADQLRIVPHFGTPGTN